jgi:hypothetical protein
MKSVSKNGVMAIGGEMAKASVSALGEKRIMALAARKMAAWRKWRHGVSIAHQPK